MKLVNIWIRCEILNLTREISKRRRRNSICLKALNIFSTSVKFRWSRAWREIQFVQKLWIWFCFVLVLIINSQVISFYYYFYFINFRFVEEKNKQMFFFYKKKTHYIHLWTATPLIFFIFSGIAIHLRRRIVHKNCVQPNKMAIS